MVANDIFRYDFVESFDCVFKGARTMKFTVQRDSLQQALAAVLRATATRVIQPILSNVLIETPDAQTLKLSATDMDFSIETLVEATVLEPGRTTLSAKKLAEIVSKLPGNTEVAVNITDLAAHIQCDASVFDVRTMSSDEYPIIRQLEDQRSLTVPLLAFIRAIQQTVFAASLGENNSILSGVFFQLSPESLEMAATDGSRLARSIETVGATSLSETLSAIIPAKALQEFSRLAASSAKDTDVVKIAIQDGQIAFRTDRLYVLTRLLDGQYPPYQQLIPKENKIVAFAKRVALIASLERAAVMANERTNIVKMNFEDGMLSLAANTPDLGDAKDRMMVQYDGEPLAIAFNYKYVLDALKVITSDDVRMETNGALAPTLFKSKDDNGFLCLVMPVQVK
jgi:DNA polymerase-3 subunit beta